MLACQPANQSNLTMFLVVIGAEKIFQRAGYPLTATLREI
jgi:hypothetical protein